MTNPLDRIITAIAPAWGLRRAQARAVLAYYEAARPDSTRKQRREPLSGSAAVRAAGTSIREQARHLEQNHDLTRGVLRVLVNNTVGAAGITVEPTPLTKAREVHEDFAAQILEVWDEWGERPEVTRQYTWPAVQRLFARTAYRDGECLQRFVTSGIRHATDLPLSIELMEPDFLPIGHDTTANGRRVRDGIEFNEWGAPLAFWVYRGHPRDTDTSTLPWTDLKRLSAEDVIHYALRDRLHQRRGMSALASVIERIEDIKDYETSEAVAAKVAASLGAAITKGTPDLYQPPADDTGERDMKFRAGMIFDNLAPGESIQMIGANGRPNPALVPFRNGLLRAISSGTSAAYPSVSRDYEGSYSSQRQALLDAWVDYAVLSQDLAATLIRPTYRRVILLAIATGRLKPPRDVHPSTWVSGMYVMPQIPWIDPLKEANAWATLEEAGHASGPEIIRRRGRSPSDVIREETAWRKRWREAGEPIAATETAAAPSAAPEQPTTSGELHAI